MFIEVYSEDDKEKLINLGYKFIKSVSLDNGTKYLFANNKPTHNLENIKVTYSNTIQF